MQGLSTRSELSRFTATAMNKGTDFDSRQAPVADVCVSVCWGFYMNARL